MFLVITLCYGFAAHRILRAKLFASLLAAISSAVTFQIVGYFAVGYLDPFAPVALVTATIIALAIAIAVGSVVGPRR